MTSKLKANQLSVTEPTQALNAPDRLVNDIKRLASELRALFPCIHLIELHTWHDAPPRVVINGGNYAEGTALLRQHGLGTRSKEIYDADFKWTKISAKADDVTIEAWADGLPPSCRIVTETVKVPKTQTVDTGEFIEIQKTKVVCGQPAYDIQTQS